jgi:hypothetical protein
MSEGSKRRKEVRREGRRKQAARDSEMIVVHIFKLLK